MTNLLSRILLVLAVIPALTALIVCLPMRGHAATVLLAALFTAGCGSETARFFSAKGIRAHSPLFAFLSAFPMVVLWLATQLFNTPETAWAVFFGAFSLVVLIVLMPFAFPRRSEDIPKALAEASARVFPLLYPGLFAASIVLIAGYPGASTQAILWFLLLVFGNDSMAWVVGMLFGRSRGLLVISPNKSLEGFVGAYLGSLAATFLGPVLLPGFVSVSFPRFFVFGLVMGTAVIAGDLFESALKRSAGLKDSGNCIPGRGGFLDSFDSILFTAPVYYLLLRLLNLL